jgi:hypothetical protein
VVAKGYLSKLLSNEAVKNYIQRREPDILEQFELVVNTVSMEEAVLQHSEGLGQPVNPQIHRFVIFIIFFINIFGPVRESHVIKAIVE